MARGRGATERSKEGRSDRSAHNPVVGSTAAPDATQGLLKAGTERPGQATLSYRVASTTGGGVVSARVSGAELEAFDALIKSAGRRSRSDALRVMVRAASGFLEFSREDAAALSEIARELHKIGVNVNQIALAANRGRVPMMRAEWQAVNDLRALLPPLRKMLKQIVDERRRKGAALFQAEVAGARNG